MLTRSDIKKMAGYSYSRGVELHQQNKVRSFSSNIQGKLEVIEAWVKGSGRNLYAVSIALDKDNHELKESYCDCPAFSEYRDICKHCVAVLLEYLAQKNQRQAIMEYLESLRGNYSKGNYGKKEGSAAEKTVRVFKPARETPEALKGLLDRQARRQALPILRGDMVGKVRLEPGLTCRRGECQVEFRIGMNRTYVLKDIFAFADAMRQGEEYSYGKSLAFLHVPEMFEEKSRNMVSFILDWARENEARFSQYSYANRYVLSRTKLRYMPLRAEALERFLEVVGEDTFVGNIDGGGERQWRVEKDGLRQKLFLKGVPEGLEVTAEPIFSYRCARYTVFFKDGKVYLIPRKGREAAEEFLDCLKQQPGEIAFFGKEDIPAFFRQLLPALRECMDCTTTGLQVQEWEPESVTFKFYLDLPQPDFVTCAAFACYGEREYSVYDGERDMKLRDLYREREVARLVGSLCNAFDEENQMMVISREERLQYLFLTEGVEKLRQLGEVFVSDALKKLRLIGTPRVTAGISLSGDLLELEIASEELDRGQLAELLSRYDRRKKYYRLRDGSLLRMEEDGFLDLEQLKKGLGLSEKQLRQEKVELPRYRALFLAEQLQGGPRVSVNQNRDFAALISRMKDVGDNAWEIPPSLEGTLREYQKYGYRWLRTLEDNGFGGILADDMGLGKTLQVICFLAARMTQEAAARCLIVCPASLVYNWKSELERFAPQLPVRMVTGTAPERERLLADMGKGEILITSYDLLRRDLPLYEPLHFFCQVIDEAQYIKNQGTQAARAVKAICAGFKVALTGTPVENRLSELWSIFDYLMPGYLYAYSRFREELEQPIVQREDREAAMRLQKLIRPFVLRRLKREVLQDLPEKLEENVFAQLEGEQRQLYDAHVKRLQLMLEKEEDFDRSKLQILAELTKLRQLCCDPGLLFDKYNGGSAKRELAKQLVTNAVANGHKVLLFSQFTSMLERLTQDLTREGIDYYLLTGATPKEKRAQMAEAFQYDETPVFCISLKAGGTGLNLTAADVVLHFDPWWNVAAQNQATDRVHRIGQKNIVNVYRLIAQGTIEEKIIALQERKRELADRILSGAGSAEGNLTKEELLELLGSV